MVRRTSAVRRRGLTAYKLVELLTGEIMYPMSGYDGYGDGTAGGGHTTSPRITSRDEMRQDWEANREALWPSGAAANTR